MYLVSSARRVVPVIPGTCSKKKRQEKKKKKDTDEDAPCEERLCLLTWRCREISPLQKSTALLKKAPATSPAVLISATPSPPAPPPAMKKKKQFTITATSHLEVQLKELVPVYEAQ